MPCKVEWFLRSPSRAISDAEKAALLELAARERDQRWQVGQFPLFVAGGGGMPAFPLPVAGGGTSMPDDLTHADWTLLLDALTRLRLTVPDATCEVRDPHALITWNGELGRYTTTAWGAPPVAAPEPVRDLASDERAVHDGYATLRAGGDARKEGRRILDASEPELVFTIGLALLATRDLGATRTNLFEANDVAGAVREAARKLGDLAVHAAASEAIAAAWGPLASSQITTRIIEALQPLADRPAVRERAVRAVESDATDPVLRAAAIKLLREATGAAREITDVLVARARRDRELNHPRPWRSDLINALGRLRRPDSFATLVLEAADDGRLLREVVRALAACDAVRALPLLIELREMPGVDISALVEAIAAARTPEATAVLLTWCDVPIAKVRATVAEMLLARDQLAMVAAIWRTLDAVAFTAYGRDRALAALGGSAGTAVDWDELVRAKGLAPVALAPMPSSGDSLAAPPSRDAAVPSLVLAPEQRIQLDAEEAAVAARAAAPGAREIAAPPGGDVFEGAHPELAGDTLEAATVAPGQPDGGVLLPSWLASEGLLVIAPGDIVAGVRDVPGDCVDISVVANVQRRTRWLRIDALEAIVRDGDGRALAVLRRAEGKLLDAPARLYTSGHDWIHNAVYRGARTVDVRALVREPFQTRAGRWRLGAVDLSRTGEIPLAATAEPPVLSLPALTSPVRATASCFVTAIRDSRQLDLMIELALVAPAFAVTPVDVAIVFRDRHASPIEVRQCTRVLPADGSSTFERGLYRLESGAAETLEVIVRGARTQTVPLARFAIS